MENILKHCSKMARVTAARPNARFNTLHYPRHVQPTRSAIQPLASTLPGSGPARLPNLVPVLAWTSLALAAGALFLYAALHTKR